MKTLLTVLGLILAGVLVMVAFVFGLHVAYVLTERACWSETVCTVGFIAMLAVAAVAVAIVEIYCWVMGAAMNGRAFRGRE